MPSYSRDLNLAESRSTLLDKIASALSPRRYFCTSDRDSFINNAGLPDLDLYCERPDQVAEMLREKSLELLGHSVSVKKLAQDHYQVFVTSQEFQLGVLDLHGPGTFRAMGVRESLFDDMLRRQTNDTNPGELKRLDNVGLATMRYLDYLAVFWDGRDKLRHLEWILENLTRDQIIQVFELMVLHGTGRPLRSRRQSLRDFIAGIAIFWTPGWLFRFVGRIRSRPKGPSNWRH